MTSKRKQVAFEIIEMEEMQSMEEEMGAKWQEVFDRDYVQADNIIETYRNYMACNLAYGDSDEMVTQDMINYAMTAILTW